MRWLLLLVIAAALLLPAAPASAAADPDGFADAAFDALWARADRAVAIGSAQRSWTYGAGPGEIRYERFSDVPGGARLVQYFDKARMEVNDPNGDRRSPWFVTGGRLVVELITGQMQTGNTAFETRAPAAVPVAGDPLDNPQAPTYAQLAPYVSFDGGGRAPSRIGARVTALLGPAGLSERPDLGLTATTIARYEPVTGHNVPRAFHDFMRSGPIDALFAFGYPISEPYWASVRVGGKDLPVMFQAFERRLLTYNPANPPRWQVEMGNVGQHYFLWRHGRALRYAAPPFAGVQVRETSIEIPTYGYEQALTPTNPGDPIYPYARLDPARVGPPQSRAYRALIVENRFLELTLLPELGGRVYRAVDKATGWNMFYQNPVIKPAPFGQRGWWLGAGGLEWAAPTEEHGYLEASPWNMAWTRQNAQVNVDLSATERQTGLDLLAMVILRADEGRFVASFTAQNATSGPRPLQMWMNAALAPGAVNRIGPAARFVVPTNRMIVHATQDAGLPPPRASIAWPVYNGRDLDAPAAWNGYVGLFATGQTPFAGLYDAHLDAGAVVSHWTNVSGTKIFAFSKNFDRGVFTDDGSDYAELWSGAQPTFWDYPQLAPNESRTITAEWGPLQGLGDLAVASADGALGLRRRGDGGLTVVIAAARLSPAAPVRVLLNGAEIFRGAPIGLRPDLPLALELPPGVTNGTLRVETGSFALETSVR